VSDIVVREDLSRRDPRERISKSFLQTVEACGQKAWRSIHDPVPWTAPEKVTFGSAVDAGLEVIVKALARDEEPDLLAAHHQAMLRVDAEENLPDEGEVLVALKSFADWSVVHEVHWPGTITQPHLRLELPGIGEVDAHPDIILPSPTIVDAKTTPGNRMTKVAATSYTELGLYALLYEAATGERVRTVAYWQYLRGLKKPEWRESVAQVTDRMLETSRARVAAVARAIEADTLLNDGVAVPVNSVFTSPPRYGCDGCQYRPTCDWAEEEFADAAAA